MSDWGSDWQLWRPAGWEVPLAPSPSCYCLVHCRGRLWLAPSEQKPEGRGWGLKVEGGLLIGPGHSMEEGVLGQEPGRKLLLASECRCSFMNISVFAPWTALMWAQLPAPSCVLWACAVASASLLSSGDDARVRLPITKGGVCKFIWQHT